MRLRGDFVGAHRVLTAAAGMAGQDDVAKAALQELRRAQPNFSLAWIAANMPIKHDADREHYLDGFRRAGLNRARAEDCERRPRPPGMMRTRPQVRRNCRQIFCGTHKKYVQNGACWTGATWSPFSSPPSSPR